MSTLHHVFLDCDTGIDDALALTFLLNHPGTHLVGIGSVSGNTDAAKAAENTLGLLKLAGHEDIPVAIGCHDPLNGEYDGGAPHVHGHNGVGGVQLPAGPDVIAEDAADLLIRLSREYEGTLDVVAIGPFTNIAVALERDPELPSRIRSLTIMGGAVYRGGNITAHAEANVYNDAAAAQKVVEAGFTLFVVPLDVTESHVFTLEHADVLTATGSQLHVALGEMLRPYIDFYESVGFGRRAPLHDPLAAAIAVGAIAPTEFRRTALTVIQDGEERGRTVAISEGPQAAVVTGCPETTAQVIMDLLLASVPGK